MPKTKKDLILAYADKIGGSHGAKIRAVLESPALTNLKAWNEIMSEEEFGLQLNKLERGMITFTDLAKKGWPGAPDAIWGAN